MVQNAGEHSRALVIRLGALANKLQIYRYGVPKSVVSELLTLSKEMREDKGLCESAPFYFAVLGDLILYVDAKNAGKKVLAEQYMSRVETKWNVIDAELTKVIANGN